MARMKMTSPTANPVDTSPLLSRSIVRPSRDVQSEHSRHYHQHDSMDQWIRTVRREEDIGEEVCGPHNDHDHDHERGNPCRQSVSVSSHFTVQPFADPSRMVE